MKAPVFKLPAPQPPRPSPADLAPLVAFYKEADKAGAHRWQATQRNGLLRYAIEFLKNGQWDRAEDNCETALKREEELGGDYAARFADVLIKLKGKATHKSNGAALKVSLKAEIEEKKETPHVSTKQVPTPRVLLQKASGPGVGEDMGRAVPCRTDAALVLSSPSVQEALQSLASDDAARLDHSRGERATQPTPEPAEATAPRSHPEAQQRVEPTADEDCVVPGCTDKQSVYGDAPLCPEHRRQGFTPEMCDELERQHGITNEPKPEPDPRVEVAQKQSRPKHFAPSGKGERAITGPVHPVSGGETPRLRALREATPEHPLLLAAHKRYLLAGYWGAISSRDPETIRLAVKFCKEVGLEEVYKETVWQLANRELHQAHRRARHVAVEAWEGMVME